MYEQNPSVVTSYLEFAGRGQLLTIDSGWREVDATLDWLESQKLEADVRHPPPRSEPVVMAPGAVTPPPAHGSARSA